MNFEYNAASSTQRLQKGRNENHPNLFNNKSAGSSAAARISSSPLTTPPVIGSIKRKPLPLSAKNGRSKSVISLLNHVHDNRLTTPLPTLRVALKKKKKKKSNDSNNNYEEDDEEQGRKKKQQQQQLQSVVGRKEKLKGDARKRKQQQQKAAEEPPRQQAVNEVLYDVSTSALTLSPDATPTEKDIARSIILRERYITRLEVLLSAKKHRAILLDEEEYDATLTLTDDAAFLLAQISDSLVLIRAATIDVILGVKKWRGLYASPASASATTHTPYSPFLLNGVHYLIAMPDSLSFLSKYKLIGRYFKVRRDEKE
jgi:hypothetical protein